MADKMTLIDVRDVLRAAGRFDIYGTDEQACDLADALDAHLAAMGEPVAVMYQHDETGRTTCVDLQQVEWGWEKNNPGWTRVQNLFTASPASGDWDKVREVIAEMDKPLAPASWPTSWLEKLTAALPENANV